MGYLRGLRSGFRVIQGFGALAHLGGLGVSGFKS